MSERRGPRLLYIVFAIFAFPFVMLTFMPLLMNIFVVSKLAASLDDTFKKNSSNYSNADIAFGGNEEQAQKTFERLRSITATPAQGTIRAQTLSVAIVTLTSDRTIVEPTLFGWGTPSVRPQPIQLDLEHAINGAMLLIADRPVLWSPINMKSGLRAKIAVEGTAVFDIENAPHGLLAGFRIGAFGADRATSPQDLGAYASSANIARFCASIKVWAKHFQIDPDNIRIWRFTDPTQISLQGKNLSATGGSTGKLDHISEHCR